MGRRKQDRGPQRGTRRESGHQKKKKGKGKNPFIRTETGLAIRGIQKIERSGKIKLFPK